MPHPPSVAAPFNPRSGPGSILLLKPYINISYVKDRDQGQQRGGGGGGVNSFTIGIPWALTHGHLGGLGHAPPENLSILYIYYIAHSFA